MNLRKQERDAEKLARAIVDYADSGPQEISFDEIVGLAKSLLSKAEGNKTLDCWSLANMCMNEKQRCEFNQWHGEAYMKAEAVRDWSRSVGLRFGVKAPSQINELMELICEVPWLSK